jgi:DNA-binding response OmpR family regulator
LKPNKRTLHTVKGDAGMSGLTEVSEVFHRLESVLEHYLAEDVCPTDIVLRVRDWLQKFLEGIAANEPCDSTGAVAKGAAKDGGACQVRLLRAKERRGMKILIAEDDLTSRTILEGVLEKWGYEFVSVADGQEAWDVLQQADAPELAILDWMMPGMSGPEVCRNLRAQERSGPLYIILLTSKDGRQDIIEGLEAGADDYVAKPYDIGELRVRVQVGCRLLKLQHQLEKRKKLQGVLEMAGAVCHEINQPLQVVSGCTEMLLMEVAESDANYATFKNIKANVDRIGKLTHKIMRISKYAVRDYMGGKNKIIDIENSTSKFEE